MHVLTQGESIYIAIDAGCEPPEKCDPPAEFKVTGTKTKTYYSNRMNPRGGMIITHNYTR